MATDPKSQTATRETVLARWESDNPKGCRVPEPMIAGMAIVCHRLRQVHCAKKKTSHECSGRLIIDRNGMTLSCPLCGDERSVYAWERANG